MTINRSYATPEEMERWARTIMDLLPHDFAIGPEDDPYMLRWHIIPRNEQSNVYLHKILHSDDDRAMHDHPWPNTSLLIAGQYIEHTPEGSFLRSAGDVITRPAEALHRLELVGDHAISLFMSGQKEREWGFACPNGWVHWKDFTASDNPGAPGRGCGEA